MIRLVFCRGAGIADAAIRFYDHGYWNHVEVASPRSGLGVRLGAQDKQYGIVPPGCYWRHAGYTRNTAEGVVDLYTIKDEETLFWDFMIEQLGKPYDKPGLMRHFLESVIHGGPAPMNRNWREPDSWWCSELVGASLEAAGLFKFSTPLNVLSPNGLFMAVASSPCSRVWINRNPIQPK